MKNLFISPSLYSLFLYILLDESWDKSDYILSYRIPKIIHDNIRNKGIEVYSTPIFTGNILKRAILENLEYLKFLKYSSEKKYNKIYGNDEFHYSYKYREKGIDIIEDGPFNSESKQFFKKRRFKQDSYLFNYWFYWLWRNYIPYGYDYKVKKIWHTDKIKLPKEINSKGSIINLTELWNNKNNKQKEDILSVFGIDVSLIHDINKYNHVLVTQVLPIPDKDKIKIYKSMVGKIDERKLLIKTHYAENTDYAKAFPKAKIISTPVPFQLFELLDYSPNNIYTISSSAVLPFIKKDTNITFLGTEIDERIKKEYGLITLEKILNK